ncbi:FecR domain-containing protein [uncultured Algoriphagus sp.]|uniref:FecR family protein n=1 Tax=uncultured Algoriphagus sp. TaxID=417365 RepID=UPI0030EE780E|tara:strand:+ start:11959 stop:13005 length:1047 start_codon:yes stop_codon:yes gene_type:complete
MEFKPKSEADFLKHPLFMKWAVNPNPELNRYWSEWVEANRERKEMLLRAKELTKTIEWKDKYHMDEKDFSQMRNKLLEFNSKWESQKELKTFSGRGRKNYSKWWPVAASLLIAGVLLLNYIGSVDNRNMAENVQPEWVVKSTQRGMKKVFHLPDGSTVTLNSASEIRYLDDFSSKRTVELIGQAFFEVERNEQLPFTVKSGDLSTTVLGTSFDVSAYPDEDQLHVAVVTGKVKVDTENGVSATILPSEATYYDTQSKSLKKGGYDYNHLLGWRHRILKFDEEPYPQVFERLSRWYNVRFEFSPSLELNGKYSGEFQDESLENVLNGMQYSLGISYEIRDGTVRISKKK